MGFSRNKAISIYTKKRKKYVAKINVEKGFKKKDDVMSMLIKLLGDEANITVELVNEIPELASGKRKYVVNSID